MILRIYKAIVHEGQQSAFRRFFETTAIPELKTRDGMLRLHVGWPHETSPREFSMVTVWRDLDALIGFTGDGWQEAVVHPDEAHLLERTVVSHYDVDEA